jgi:hypothetical protein
MKAAEPSPPAKHKKAQKITPESLPVQSFSTFVATLGTRCQMRQSATWFPRFPDPVPLQARALHLLRL